ncbi:hypothetical protein AB0C34_17265 [Nocardia sp. NPDC049220]|uniref:hypothetical protein n=1 Tax=Nocardia sp. NPDC049220 TaxID=3155273 RepID=UPI0033FBAE08
MTTTAAAPAATATADGCERLTALADRCGFETNDLWEQVHDVASQSASDASNGGVGAQVKFLIDALGESAAEQVITTQAVEKVDDALSTLERLIPDLRAHLHASSDEAAFDQDITSFGTALTEMYQTLHGLTADDPRREKQPAFLHALLAALTSYDTLRVREQYIDRARLLAGLAKYQAMLAAYRAPVCDPIAVDPEDGSEYPIVFLELPADEDGFGGLGPNRQFTRHMKRSDLQKQLPWLRVVPASDPAAPHWNGHSKDDSNQLMDIWAATPLTGSDPSLAQATTDER